MSSQNRVLTLICTLSVSALHGQELPPRAVARLGDYRFYHGSSIELVAMSPDGSRVASLARKPSYYHHITDADRDPFDRTIVIWDTATGQRLRELIPEKYGRSLTFAPDGKKLVVVSGPAESKSHIVFIDVDTGKVVDQFGEFKETADVRQFSADGKRLLICEGSWCWADAVISLDIASRRVQKRWQAPASKSAWVKERERATRAVPSPDGKFIAWHIDELPDYSKLPRDIPPPWVPRPTVLVVTNAVADKVLYRKDFGRNGLDPFAYAADGRWFLTRGDEKVVAWETATGKELFSLADPKAYGFALSPDGRWALVSGNRRCRLWDLETKKAVHELHGSIGYRQEQVFSADGKTVVLWNSSTLRVFDTATGKERASPIHRARQVMVRFSEDGSKLFSNCSETRITWDVSSGRKPIMLSQVPRQAWEIGGSESEAQSNDSRFFVDEVNRRIRIRSTSTGLIVHELDKDDWRGTFARFSPDATRLALRRYFMETGIDKDGNAWIRLGKEREKLCLYDTKTGKKSGEIKLENGLSWVVPVFSPDGKTLAWADHANDVHLHDAVTGKLMRTLRSIQPLPSKECNDGDVLFSPDGQYLIVTTYCHELFADPNDDTKWNTLPTRVFDVASGKEVRRFYGNPEKTRSAAAFSCVACSPDNRLLAVAEKESGTIRLIEINSGKVRVEFKGHREGVHDLAFSPDSKTLASGGEDNVVYLWNVIGPGGERDGRMATAADLPQWWTDLADARRVDAAVGSFMLCPEPSAQFLSARVRPIEPLDEKRVAQLFADLDADNFAMRRTASEELANLGDRIEGALKAHIKKHISVEARTRIQALVDKLDARALPAPTLQNLRAIEVLERIGTTGSRLCLEKLATGAPEAWETRAAKSALARFRPSARNQ
jgi:WD40 repeat protein